MTISDGRKSRGSRGTWCVAEFRVAGIISAMRHTFKIAAFALGLTPALAAAQTPNYPQTLPANTVVGRLGVSAGPTQAIPFSTFISSVLGASKITIGSTQISLGQTATTIAGLTLTSPTINGGTLAGTFAGSVFSNANLVTAGAATLKGNPGSGSALVQDFTIQGLTNLASPSLTLDLIPIYDHTSGTIKNISLSQFTSNILNSANTWTGANTFNSGINLFTNSVGGIGQTGTVSSNLNGNNFGGGPPEQYGIYNNLQSNVAYALVPEIGFANVFTSFHGAGNGGSYHVATGNVGTMFPGSSPVWAQTNVLTMHPGVGSYQGTGIEVDFNNWNMNYTPAMSAAGHSAMNIILTGTNNDGLGNGGYATAAMVVAFGGSTTAPMWDFGADFGISGFRNFNTATIRDTSNSPTSVLISGTHTSNIIDISTATTSGFKINGNQFKVDNIGNEYALTNNATSDARLKHDIVPLPDGALAKLMQLAPKNYVLNSDTSNKLRAHLIAQDLVPLIPEAVVQDSTSGYYAVDDAPILAYTIKAVQEMKNANDNLTARVDALERAGAR